MLALGDQIERAGTYPHGTQTQPMTRLARTLILAAFVVSHIGFPTIDLWPSDSGGSYPCDGHNCGCRSADHCWNHCCCMSRNDRLAWAAAHDVTPPVGLLEQSEDEPLAHANSKHSCAKHELGSATVKEKRGKKIQVRWVTAIAAMKCKGHTAQSWTGVEPSLPIAKISFAVDAPPCGFVQSRNERCELVATEPPLSYG